MVLVGGVGFGLVVIIVGRQDSRKHMMLMVSGGAKNVAALSN